MKNLNAEQVKKALENCENECCDACENCPSPPNTSGGCVVFVMRQSLALITSQEQRIKELTVELEAMRGAANSYKMHNKKLTEENERLKAQKYYIHSDGRIETIPSVESVRADTVRKMQERLGEHFVEHNEIKYGGGLIHKIIDQIAKEMIGEEDTDGKG